MRPRGLEPPRTIQSTRPSTLDARRRYVRLHPDLQNCQVLERIRRAGPCGRCQNVATGAGRLIGWSGRAAAVFNDTLEAFMSAHPRSRYEGRRPTTNSPPHERHTLDRCDQPRSATLRTLMILEGAGRYPHGDCPVEHSHCRARVRVHE